MKRVISLSFSIGLVLFCILNTLAQQDAKHLEETIRKQRESEYIAPIRYVIVYNDIFKLDERRIEILMEESQYNEKNLRETFNLIKNRFPLPVRLRINVHTSLNTIETPEEREMWDNSRGRFPNQWKYKTAGYNRFCGGTESFSYAADKAQYRKVVVLVNKPACKLQ